MEGIGIPVRKPLLRGTMPTSVPAAAKRGASPEAAKSSFQMVSRASRCNSASAAPAFGSKADRTPHPQCAALPRSVALATVDDKDTQPDYCSKAVRSKQSRMPSYRRAPIVPGDHGLFFAERV